MGPEGLGDWNDVDEEVEEQEREDEPGSPQGPIAEKAILGIEAVNIVSALAALAKDCLLPSAASGIISNTHAVIQALQASPRETKIPQLDIWPQGGIVFLVVLAKSCQKAEVLEARAHLNYWLSVLTFACQMNRYVHSSDHSVLVKTLNLFREM